MASSDPDSKPTNSEKEKPKAAAKAKPKGRKPKPKAQAKAVPEDTAKRDLQAQEKGMNPAAEEKKQSPEKTASELPAKKKGRPKGRKAKAKPTAAEVAAAETEAQSPQKPIETNSAATEKSKKQQGPSQPQAGMENVVKKRGRPKGPKPKTVSENEAQAQLKPEKSKTAAAQTGESPESSTKPQAAAEKPLKKRGRPKGRKPKAKPESTPEKPEIAIPARQEEAAPKANAAAEGKGNVDQDGVAQAEVAQAETTAKKKSRSKNRRSKAKSKQAKENELPVQDQQVAAPEKEVPAPETPEETQIAEKAIEYMGPPLPDINLSPLGQGKVRVIIGSQNPAKIRAAELAFTRMFPDESMEYISAEVESGVSDQPMSDDESFAGAIMRAQLCREAGPEATYWVGIEGGLEEIGDELHAFAWMVILGPDKLMGKARTSTFVLPPVVADLIREGKELGEADDIVFERQDSKLDSGAVGILTQGLFDRAQYYADALIMALIPFKNPHLYNLDLLEAAEAEA